MNTLLVLIVLLLTVVVIWMIAMTVLYHNVCKSFEALKDLVVNVVGDQNKTITEINRGLESFLELFKECLEPYRKSFRRLLALKDGRPSTAGTDFAKPIDLRSRLSMKQSIILA